MSQATQGSTVKIHYKGTLSDGTLFDSSEGRDPLEFMVGSGQVIPGFDKAVDGMSVGDEKEFTVPAAEAYGEIREELVVAVPKTEFPSDVEVEVGQRVQVEQPDGNIVVTVSEISEETITLDGNHPLAGKALTFAVSLVEIVS